MSPCCEGLSYEGSIDFLVFGGGGGGLLSVFVGKGGVNCRKGESLCQDLEYKKRIFYIYLLLNMH